MRQTGEHLLVGGCGSADSLASLPATALAAAGGDDDDETRPDAAMPKLVKFASPLPAPMTLPELIFSVSGL